MAQIFWEQIRNELPEIGEFLTGSLSISGSFSNTGSLSINLNGVDDIFSVNVNGNEKVKVNNKWLVSGNKVSKEQVERAIKEQHEEGNLHNQMVTKLVEESANGQPTSEEVEDPVKELQEKDK